VHVLALVLEAIPRGGVPLTKRHVLGIGTERDDDRHARIAGGPKHVGVDRGAVAQRDRYVVLDDE
jgi:hypothetical protein